MSDTVEGPRSPITDGIVTIRRPEPDDARAVVAGRDAEFHRWLGPGGPSPRPTACIVVDGGVVGWVDAERTQPWLREGEVNVGDNVFPDARGRGYASRGVQLLAHHLARQSGVSHLTLLIDADNTRSLALADRLAFEPRPPRQDQPAGQRFFVRPLSPTTYADGQNTIRALEVADLEAKDDEQIDWL